jgi:hypothetical protein
MHVHLKFMQKVKYWEGVEDLRILLSDIIFGVLACV